MANESIKAMAQFTEILRNNPNHAYDFISNNYWKMSKEELANIAKELLYGVEEYVLKGEFKAIMENVAVELDEQYDEHYQEE